MGLRTARANLSQGIRLSKRQYSKRIADHFSDCSNIRNLWRGMQTITEYKPSPQTCDSSISLLNQLNNFVACFEADNSIPAQKTPSPPQQLNHKLDQLGFGIFLCKWLLYFLTGRPQAVRVGNNTSSTVVKTVLGVWL